LFGVSFHGVKRPEREADHSPPSSTEVKNTWRYTSTPQYVFMAWCLVKHRDSFTFYLSPWDRLPLVCLLAHCLRHSSSRWESTDWFLSLCPLIALCCVAVLASLVCRPRHS